MTLHSMNRREALVTLAAGACTAPALAGQPAAEPLTVVIVDPLAAPLSCPCVKGYAQRDYEKLARFLEPRLGRRVWLHFAESLPHALTKLTAGKADLVIGKDSTVRAGAEAARLALTPVALLTDKTGKTTQTGLFVVANADPALTAGDLTGYRLLFGPADCDEKHAAALTLLKELSVPAPATLETCISCSVGATKVVDLHKNGEKVATVISSYALPLLEGCDTIKKGDLRVVGETSPVPFITAFASERLAEAERTKLRAALLAVADEAALCTALETKLGFVAPAAEGVKKVTAPADNGSWTGWRGPNRDGRVAWLPDRLPAQSRPVWEVELTSRGLGGVAATAEYVLVSDRELNDTNDLFRCLRADTGQEVWAIRYPAPGNLDYGNSPRATPLIAGEYVYLFGAFGHLTCAELATGKVVWDMNIRDEFEAADERKWGMCSSPLLVEDKLIMNPGAKTASLVALEPRSGKVIWKTPGKTAAYGSFIAAKRGGKQQIIGYDEDSLGGWEVASGKRLWRLVPDSPNDFNVPTPIAVGQQLFVCTENNRARLYEFASAGAIVPEPVAVNRSLAPDTHTPVIVGGRVFGVWRRLFCLSLGDGLKPLWDRADGPFQKYCAIVASDTRVLVVSLDGELVLLDATTDAYRELGRLAVWKGERGCYAHPALVGGRLYLRGSSSVAALALDA